MKRLALSFSLLLVLFLYQNCAQPEGSEATASPAASTNSNLSDSAIAFKTTLYPLVRDSCGNCHDERLPFFAVASVQSAHDTLINSNLVDLSNVSNSRIVIKINGGHQSYSSNMGYQLETAITNWVNQL